MVILAEPIKQVADRISQLVERKHGVHLMRLQVLHTEGGHAGQAGLGCFFLHTCVTMDEIFLLYLDRFSGHFNLTIDYDLGIEIFHDGAEDRVFLQLWSGGEGGPTLGTAEAAAVSPGHQETIIAEVVSTGDGDWTLKGAQTDAAGQILSQVEQLSHDVTSNSLRKKRNRTDPRKRK